jgi:hypothetical protein
MSRVTAGASGSCRSNFSTATRRLAAFRWIFGLLVQRVVQRLTRPVVTVGTAGLRTTPSRLPKLDVEGSSPFARSEKTWWGAAAAEFPSVYLGPLRSKCIVSTGLKLVP